MPCPKMVSKQKQLSAEYEHLQKIKKVTAEVFITNGDSALDQALRNSEQQLTKVSEHIAKCTQIRNYNMGTTQCLACDGE